MFGERSNLVKEFIGKIPELTLHKDNLCPNNERDLMKLE
jgi:hypothetical protein